MSNDSSSDFFKREKLIFDNIHGYIDLYKPEMDIVNSELFQRLRGINQLGMAHLVYPGATHTRFVHSLGVMHVITRMMNALGINPPLKSESDSYTSTVETLTKIPCAEDKHYFFTIRMAGLLHDVGHLPFSHTFERAFFKHFLPKGRNASPHEFFSSQLIDFPTIKAVLENPLYKQYNYNMDIMKAMITGELANCPKRYVQLLHSIFDADRIDYLLRDTYATGLVYGHIDLERIFKHLRIVQDNDDYIIAINEKAALSVDQYLLGRYYMYNTVYYHKTNFCFEEMTRKIVKKSNILGKLPPRKEDSWVDGEDPLSDDLSFFKTIQDNLEENLKGTDLGSLDLVTVFAAIARDFSLDENAQKRIEKELCRFTDHFVWDQMYLDYLRIQSKSEAGESLEDSEAFLMELYPLLFARQSIKLIWETSSMLEGVKEEEWKKRIKELKERLQMDAEIHTHLQKARTLVRILNEFPILEPPGERHDKPEENAVDFLKNIYFFQENDESTPPTVKSIYQLNLSILKTIIQLYKYQIQVFSYGTTEEKDLIKDMIDKLNITSILQPKLTLKDGGEVKTEETE